MLGVCYMKKMFNSFLNSIEYQYLEFFSYLLIILWGISPIIEYIFKNYYKDFYTQYFVFIIYFVGIFGFLEYIIYIFKRVKDKNFSIKESIPLVLILILIILSFISSICSDNPHLSFFGGSYRKEGFIVYILYVGFILGSSIIKNKKYIKKFFEIVILSALFITIAPLFNPNFSYRSFSNIYHWFNHYGYFLMISTMISGFMFVGSIKVKKIIYLFVYIFLIYMLIRNDTFGCFLAIVISLFFCFIYSLVKKYKRLDIIILIVTFIMTSFFVSYFDIKIGERVHLVHTQEIVFNNIKNFSKDVKTAVSDHDVSHFNRIGTGRGLLWKGAWKFTLEHPFIGGGMECLGAYYKKNHINHSDRPHNIILQVSSFIGIPGAFVYLTFILYLAIVNLKKINKSFIYFLIYVVSMCYFISSNFGNSMYYTSPYFMILLGFLIGMLKDY